jgi:undecaprenyl-diphosphatase
MKYPHQEFPDMREQQHSNQRREVLLFAVLMTISLIFFLLFAQNNLQGELNIIDNAGFHVCRMFSGPGNISIALFFSFFGTGTFLIPVYLLIVHYLIKIRHSRYTALVITLILTSLLSGWALKAVFHRPRPPFPLVNGGGWYSFPSGHALGAFTFSSICIFLLWKEQVSIHKKWLFTGLFIVFGTLVGLSRIYLQLHYATDVIGSLFFTVFLTSLVYLIYRVFFEQDMHKVRSLKTHDK